MLMAKVRQSVSPYAGNSGGTACTLAAPRVIVGTQARACAAFTPRFRCVSVAPLGLPVVPLVYWMIATSVTVGPGTEGLMPPALAPSARRSLQVVVPETFIVRS